MTTPSASAPRVRSTRALDVFAVACVVVALVLLVWPTSTDVVTTASAREPGAQASSAPSVSADATTAAATAANAEVDSLISAVVNGNVFSATRRAPRTRFVAPGESSPVAEASPAYGTSRPEVVSNDSLPRLSGIITMNGERHALLQLVAADEAPKLYRISESHAGYRIVQIGPDFVVLASRAGTRTLRLSRGVPPDSLEKQP